MLQSGFHDDNDVFRKRLEQYDAVGNMLFLLDLLKRNSALECHGMLNGSCLLLYGELDCDHVFRKRLKQHDTIRHVFDNVDLLKWNRTLERDRLLKRTRMLLFIDFHLDFEHQVYRIECRVRSLRAFV